MRRTPEHSDRHSPGQATGAHRAAPATALLGRAGAAGNRALAGALGGGAPVVQRTPALRDLPPELLLQVLASSGLTWPDFLAARSTDRAARDRLDALVVGRYGVFTPSTALRFWAFDVHRAHRASPGGVLRIARLLGDARLSPAFWDLVAEAHVPAHVGGKLVDVLHGLGAGAGVATGVDHIRDVLDLVTDWGVDYLDFLEAYLDRVQRADALAHGERAALANRRELGSALDVVMGEVDEGDVFYDARTGEGTADFPRERVAHDARGRLLRWLREETAESDLRATATLEKRLAAKLAELREVCRGEVDLGAGAAPLAELRDALRTTRQTLRYEGACREGVAGATGLDEALGALLAAVDDARAADVVNPHRGETKHQREARLRREGKAARPSAPAAEHHLPSWEPDPVVAPPGHRTGEEPSLVQDGQVHFRFESHRYGRIDRVGLAGKLTDEVLDALQAALVHGKAVRAVGESGVKERGAHYIVKLSDADARAVGLSGSADVRLRSATAKVDTPADAFGIKYFVFDRLTKSHGGGHS